MFVMVLLLSVGSLNAQIFIDDEEFEGKSRTGYEDFGLLVPYQGGDLDQYLPLSDGVLVLTLLGGAYLMRKLGKKKETE